MAASLLHVVLVCSGKHEGDAAAKSHENAGLAGCIIVAVRVLLFGWFLASVRGLHSRAGLQLSVFLHQLKVAGSVYFLSYPLTFLVAQIFAQYLRQSIMQISTSCVQLATSMWLAQQFLSRGLFHEISALGSSPLPVRACDMGVTATKHIQPL